MNQSARSAANALVFLALGGCSFAIDVNTREADGGVAAEEGGDRNRDGGPDDGPGLTVGSGWKDEDDCEPAWPLTEPPLVLAGDFAELDEVVAFGGDLTLNLTAASPKELPDLTRVLGKLTIVGVPGAKGPTTLSLPNLQRVGGLTVFAAGRLEELSVPALESVDCHVRIQENARLSRLDATTWPKLTHIGGDLALGTCFAPADEASCEAESELRCATNPALKHIDLPALTQVGRVRVGDNPRLSRFVAPKLVEADAVVLAACGPGCAITLVKDCRSLPALSQVDLPALASTPILQLLYLPALTGLSMPRLRDAVEVKLAALGSSPLDLDFGALETAASFELDSSYEQCTACASPPVSRVRSLNLDSLLEVVNIHVKGPLGSLGLGSLSKAESLVVEELEGIAPGGLDSLSKVSSSLQLGGLLSRPTLPKLTSAKAAIFDAAADLDWVCHEIFPVLARSGYPDLTLTGKWTSFDCASVTKMTALRVTGTSLTEVTLPALAHAAKIEISANSRIATFSASVLTDAEVRIWENPVLTTIDASSLTTAPSLSATSLPLLSTLLVPKLARAKNGISISGTALESIQLPALLSSSAIKIGDNDALTALDLSRLRTVSEIDIHSNAALPSLSLPLKGPLGALNISDNPSLASLVTGLTEVEVLTLMRSPVFESLVLEDLEVLGTLWVEDNASLATINLPKWGPTGGKVTLRDNPLLRSVATPLLTSAMDIVATNNPSFPECEIAAWAESLTASCDCNSNAPCPM